MGAAGYDGARRMPSWRLGAMLCLLPVVLPLVLLWLPPLCLAVAVVRFRRRRRRTGCSAGSGVRSPETDGGGHRVALLQKYLEDQMELVGGAEKTI